ncbi:hypothetical protein [Microbacterium sp. MYb64]|uniref:DUF7426 family protein n=1 Tax=Microbacterium sp. MYb64 TaxID=1848691 RepID=UPI000CFC82BA|nr:hypothetical protein [Microbacterium sp. MYb64]PRB01749.1 hypothetical protein CQ044_16500 [Microbacterium sp. MYb64]
MFNDFNDLYDPLVLPINGKQYTIPPASFEAGVRINGIVGGAEKMGDEEFYRLVLGSAFDEMRIDDVPATAIDRAGKTALADFQVGRSMAEIMWKTGGDPKAIQEMAPKPNRAARRSKGTAAASKTP